MNKEFYKSIREDLELSFEDMAEELGVTDPQMVRRYEAGSTKPGGPIIRVYQLLGVLKAANKHYENGRIDSALLLVLNNCPGPSVKKQMGRPSDDRK